MKRLVLVAVSLVVFGASPVFAAKRKLVDAAKRSEAISVSVYPRIAFAQVGIGAEARVQVRVPRDERNLGFSLVWDHACACAEAGRKYTQLDDGSRVFHEVWIKHLVPGAYGIRATLYRAGEDGKVRDVVRDIEMEVR